ncbi:hypothetical protein Aspvir_004994 [Aspergillus viridinutans]|uniref:Beta-galactosidase n=1 Tax=Aspergillus viridinutans TaxID=75553 RepID=A0A9P3BRG3_ASPVI|nr:uncharacterized protein Aspvir_004994 [Aspergillus viridinutans]GIK00964.1 hypothetical protein Aspvir_004994 [Aspergillus viridinutans]
MPPQNIEIPHLRSIEGGKQLIVHGRPILILGAELQNSSLTSAEHMDTVWPNLVVNTVLGCVTWEMIEPVEGQFDFKELDKIILGARKHGLHLVLLWFGSYKNGMSTYAPAWVKKNPKRFPRMKLRKAGGVLQTTEILSIFHEEAQKSDARAFAQLMRHLKQFDQDHSTVVMVQVENETGLLGDSRDGSAAGEERFSQPVPNDLVSFLAHDWDYLHQDLKRNLIHFKAQTPRQGSWAEVFGKGPHTNKLFMAYHYALYVNQVAAAGRAEYRFRYSDNDFPVIVGGGGMPGDYPSGGCTPNVLDIWQRFAPSVDFFTPDIYLNDYTSCCSKYRHRGQPFWTAVGSYQAIGVAPFALDTLEPESNPYIKHYALLESVSQIVLEAQQRPGSSVGFFFDELAADGSDPSKPITRQQGGYEITIERAFVLGKPGPGCGMVIHRGEGKFLLIGWGFQVRATSLSPTAAYTGILRFEEKVVANKVTGELRTRRVLNGDETRSGQFAIMPNEDPDYGGFPIAITIPAKTMIAELEFYSLDESEV